MRKPASILLLSLLAFNWIGYELYISIMQYQADEALVDNINRNNYSENELISIKVAVPYLYYNTGNTDFERYDGTVEMNGVQYRYVKRRLYNDSIELLCIPNKVRTELNNARTEFFRLVNGLQHSGHSKSTDYSDAFKSFDGKYYSNTSAFCFKSLDLESLAFTEHYTSHFPPFYLTREIEPPDQA